MVIGKVLARTNTAQVKQEFYKDCLAVSLNGKIVKRAKQVYHGLPKLSDQSSS